MDLNRLKIKLIRQLTVCQATDKKEERTLSVICKVFPNLLVSITSNSTIYRCIFIGETHLMTFY